MRTERILSVVVPLVFGQRRAVFALMMLLTAFLAFHAVQLRPDAGFDKQIPLQHPYMQVFREYREAFGGANLISIALAQTERAESPDIYNAHFLDTLKKATDEVFFLPGVDRPRVVSLFTPGVRYLEIVEGGVRSGDVVPRNYRPDEKTFAAIRERVAKAELIGRLVANDQRGALIVAELLEHDPVTGEKLDYREVAQKLEAIRTRFSNERISVHIIGFAKVIGDVSDAAHEVAAFFGLALLLTVILLRLFCGSLRLSLLPLSAALVAVIWELGLLRLAGYGLDPFAILVPFLILSIAVSHGVQYINGWGNEVAEHGLSSFDASVETFRRLFIPGTVAILTNVIGFATLAFIQIEIVREMAINAALGMAAVILTNKLMLPIILTWVRLEDAEEFRRRQQRRQDLGDRLWKHVAGFATARLAVPTLAIAVLVFGWSLWMYPKLTIGDSQAGVPELRPDGRYNRDSQTIAQHFSTGVDLFKVIVEAPEYGCIDHAVMDSIDRYAWHMRNVPGVLSVRSLPQFARRAHAGWNENAPKWRSLPRSQDALSQSAGSVPTSAGLANPDCSVMPVLIFTRDHRAETLARVVEETRAFAEREKIFGNDKVRFRLASGNAGVMAATNEEIEARELVVIVWVHLTLLVFVWIAFRSVVGVIAIITPLVLCSLLTYGAMALIGIGMKAATLPVAAFGVGIGVDDGIYLWSVFARYLKTGAPLREAYFQALRRTGKAVVFTSASLIVAVCTWLFSDLQFQADMGLLLLFMFTANLFGAILLLPALAWLCLRNRKSGIESKELR